MSRRYQEQWIDVAHATTVQRGPGAQTVVVRFDTREQATAFYQSCCTGREMTDGGIRHDEDRFCPVHA